MRGVGWAILVGGAMLGAEALGQGASFTLIEPPAGWRDTLGGSISADGRVVTGYCRGAGGTSAYSWTREGGLNNFGSTPGVPINTRGRAVSADGSAVVGFRSDGTQFHAFRYSQGFYQSLEGPGVTGSAALGVSGDGRIIVGSIDGPGGLARAMRWNPETGMQEIGLAHPDDIGGWFTGISRDGVTAIGHSGGSGATAFDAYTWTQAGGWRLLPPPPGANGIYDTRPTATNLDGSLVTGFARSTVERQRVMLWRNGMPIELRSFGDQWRMSANGVSDDGRLITGGAENVETRRTTAVIWLNGSGPLDLQEYLASLGVSVPTGWSLLSCGSVSADGNTFVGGAQDQNSMLRGFVVTIPTPWTLVVPTFALVLTIRRRREPLAPGCR